MENMKLDFQMNGMNKVKELFIRIYDKSGNDLNQYINGKSLTVSNDVSDELMQEIKAFLLEAEEAVKKAEDVKSLIEEIPAAADCNKFLEWLEGFLYESVRPYQDAEYLRKADIEKFEQVSIYVFENMILSNIVSEYIDAEIVDEKQACCIRKILLTFVNRIISHNDRKEYIFNSMERRFGLCAEKCDIWWKLVKENEDRLWKIMIMRKMNLMENKVNKLLDYIQE
ncbi:MAG: hypothetical protein HFH29_13995 [Eubacterium sp.]|nr:hypothetical protein [Eubacterium sp.]